MATVKVKIVYNGNADIDLCIPDSIARLFTPDNSYIDTPIYTEGATVAGVEIPKSVYATNVAGFGELDGLKPMANTTVVFAWYSRAVDAGEDGVVFAVDETSEIYWKQIGDAMAEQGFVTTWDYSGDTPASV